jgi:hypothetical protein
MLQSITQIRPRPAIFLEGARRSELYYSYRLTSDPNNIKEAGLRKEPGAFIYPQLMTVTP